MTSLFLPALVALLATIIVSRVGGRLPPVIAAWLNAATLASMFVTALASSWLVSISFLAHEPLVDDAFGWCRTAFGIRHGVPRWIGTPALAVAAWSTGRGVRVVRTWRQQRGNCAGEVHVVPVAQPMAFAQTGRDGGVVVTSGMLEVLEGEEREALFAHERAHLRHRHDRFLVVGSLAAGVPGLNRAVAALRHALERWADEEAATIVGDRVAVAGAVARAALASHEHQAAVLSMTGANVPARVEALLAPPAGGLAVQWWSGVGALTVGSVVMAAAVQVHHLAAAFAHLCPS